jgi:hypothetical protein
MSAKDSSVDTIFLILRLVGALGCFRRRLATFRVLLYSGILLTQPRCTRTWSLPETRFGYLH